ncbi:MAG: hypothetical protein ACRC92_27585 [Peptostreptococcaceae bacterium]
MMNQINKNGAKTTAEANVYLYQTIDSIGGLPITEQLIEDLEIKKYEILTLQEVEKIDSLRSNKTYGEYVTSLMYGSEREDKLGIIQPILDFLHSKRFFNFKNKEGVSKIIGIPSHREIGTGFCSFSKMLLSIAIAYGEYTKSDDKDKSYKVFENRLASLQNAITARILSKRFKEKIQFKFNGISGVALTGNVSFDGIELPYWYCKKHGIKVGDYGLVTRDPIQNIVICLRVEGFTKNEIRVNSQTITIIDGDFDGDRLQFIPFFEIVKECGEHNVHRDTTEVILRELAGLLPTRIMSNETFARLVRDYKLA